MFRNDMLKVYFDTEFTGLHKDTKLISIGAVTNKGDTFYAEINDLSNDELTADPWIKKYVIDNLLFNDRNDTLISSLGNLSASRHTMVKASFSSVSSILNDWLKFIRKDLNTDNNIQFYCDCGYFDMVLLIDLITNHGTSFDLPKYVSYIPVDLCTAFQLNDIDPDINREDFLKKHNIGIISKLDKAEDEFTRSLDRLNIKINLKNMKHNALWDAIVAKYCFNLIH